MVKYYKCVCLKKEKYISFPIAFVFYICYKQKCKALDKSVILCIWHISVHMAWGKSYLIAISV